MATSPDDTLKSPFGDTNALLAPDSPYVQGAQTAARQDANSRGLINSSMATQAGTKAAYDAAAPLVLQNMQGDQATNLANIEAQYKDLMQTSASASQLFNGISGDINSSMSNPQLSAENKQAAVDKQTQLLQNGLGVIGGINNLDLKGLLSFGP